MVERYVILGAGGFAREAALHIMDYELFHGHDKPDFLFVDDITATTEIKLRNVNYPVIKDWFFPAGFTRFTIGIGQPQAKKVMVAKALQAGLEPHKTIIHPGALVQDAKIGNGGIIAPGVVVTTNIIIGDYVILNLNCTVGHDTVIEDFVTCNPLCSISGNVRLENGCFIGAGATVLEKKTVGGDAVVGAQACVVSDLPPQTTYVGIPAKELKK